jgi:hypothetical protein
MKRILPVLTEKVVTERKVQQSAPIAQKTKIGTILPKVSGGKIYEYNPETGEIKEAQFETKDYFLFAKNTATIIQKLGCSYVEATNLKNAKRKAKIGTFVTIGERKGIVFPTTKSEFHIDDYLGFMGMF